jgi:hypothetical protein
MCIIIFLTNNFKRVLSKRNLQAAVCSYLDIENSTKLPSMALVQDPIASESENIEPNLR